MVGRRSSHPFALAAVIASMVALAWPGEAEAAPRDDRPWGRGTVMPRIGLSPWGLFNQDIASLSFGLGGEYFVVNGLSLGLDVSDTIFIYRSAFKAQYPGIERQLPTNSLELVPALRYVFFRSRWFSPYVRGGVGPVFFNHGAGTHGQWVGEPGVFINLSGPLYLDLGVGFSGLFPGGRCNEALTYRPEDSAMGGVALDLCSFRWGPQIGFVVSFGGGGRGRERRPPPREREPMPVPASNPLDEAVVPEVEAPSDVNPPPSEPTEPTEPPVIGPQPPEGTEAAPAEPDGDALPPAGTDPAVTPADPDADPPTPAPVPGSTNVPLPPTTARITLPR